MRKLSISALTILCISLLLFSCKKDEIILYGDAQNPIGDLYPDLKYIGATVNSFLPQELGCQLRFNDFGRITKFCAYVPDNGTFRVTLWDLIDTSAIHSEHVNAVVAQHTCQSIDPIEVIPGKPYALTIYTFDYYTYVDHIGVDIFPVDIGNVELVDFRRIGDVSGLVYPTIIDNDVLAGMADIEFEPEL